MPVHIAISYLDSVPAETIDEFKSVVSERDLEVVSEVREPGVYAALEWLIPTAVFVFIGKAYFEAFFKKMGEDHYSALKAGLKTLGGRLRKHDFKLMGTPGKVSNTPKYSATYSILADAEDGMRFKLLIQRDLSASQQDIVIDLFMNFLENFYAHTLDDDILRELASYRPIVGTVLVTFDPISKQIEFPDPRPTPKG